MIENRVKQVTMALATVMCLNACDPEEQPVVCDLLLEEASLFIGEWEWAYTVMSFNYSSPPYNPNDYIDTVTPISTGMESSISFLEDGYIVVGIDGVVRVFCMSEVTFEHQESGFPAQCFDHINFSYLGVLGSRRAGAIIDCVEPDLLKGGLGQPHGYESPPPIPTPELSSDYEITGLQSFFRRVQ